MHRYDSTSCRSMRRRRGAASRNDMIDQLYLLLFTSHIGVVVDSVREYKVVILIKDERERLGIIQADRQAGGV